MGKYSTLIASLFSWMESNSLVSGAFLGVSRLPTYVIDAFKSTLEESLAADLILLLIDCSGEKIQDIRIKYSSCWNVLDELKVNASKVIVILSKSDSTYSGRIEEITNALRVSNPLIISSETGYGIHNLKTMMADHLVR